jgi:hypothetical protein
VNRLTDTRWMPDPRSEPLLGVPVVGDVAYMILGDKGVPDVLPALAHKKANELRMDDYFLWPSVGDHRQRLQNAVKAWLRSHPDCCRASPIALKSAPAQARFRMSDSDLGRARTHFSQLRPGMSSDEILKIAGKPDAKDAGVGSPEHYRIISTCLACARATTTRPWPISILSKDGGRKLHAVIRCTTNTLFCIFLARVSSRECFPTLRTFPPSSHDPRPPGSN